MSEYTTAIEVAGLTKSYGDVAVLRGIDLTVPAGTVYALLGPNGAGKTTMVRILSTLTRPTRARPGSPGSTSAGSPTAYADRSASPGSSPRSTSC